MQVGVWAPTKKLTKSQLTIIMQVGVLTEIGFPISTDNASWGWDDEINFEKYHICPTPDYLVAIFFQSDLNHYHVQS